MAVTDGTNAGFVTAAPSTDPDATHDTIDTYAVGVKITSPAVIGTISSMGWHCSAASEAADFEIGIYAHDAGNDKPAALLASSGAIAKGTTGGWKTANVNYTFAASTIYWMVVQVDDTATTTYHDYTNTVGARGIYLTGQTSLPSPWSAGGGTTGTTMYAHYALYTEDEPATNVKKINIGDVWKELAGIQINIGDAWKAVAGIQINIGDDWKAIF